MPAGLALGLKLNCFQRKLRVASHTPKNACKYTLAERMCSKLDNLKTANCAPIYRWEIVALS